MKHKIIYICLLFVILNTQCKKSSNATDVPGLPPATQIGANTFGCLVNGTVFKPTTRNDLSLDLDLGFNNGIFSLAAYMSGNGRRLGAMNVGIKDSLRFLKPPFTRNLFPTQIGSISYGDSNYCYSSINDTAIYRKGWVSVTRLDYTNGIISGLFEGALYNKICGDTIKITNGRFDFKFF